MVAGFGDWRAACKANRRNCVFVGRYSNGSMTIERAWDLPISELAFTVNMLQEFITLENKKPKSVE